MSTTAKPNKATFCNLVVCVKSALLNIRFDVGIYYIYQIKKMAIRLK